MSLGRAIAARLTGILLGLALPGAAMPAAAADRLDGVGVVLMHGKGGHRGGPLDAPGVGRGEIVAWLKTKF